MTSATAKQLRFWERLAKQAGQAPTDEELDAFAKLSVREASAKIDELKGQGSSQHAGSSAQVAEEISEEPE